MIHRHELYINVSLDISNMPWSYGRLACITLPAYNCVVVGFHIINSQISSNMMDEFGAKPKANNNDISYKQPYKVRWSYQRLSVTRIRIRLTRLTCYS